MNFSHHARNIQANPPISSLPISYLTEAQQSTLYGVLQYSLTLMQGCHVKEATIDPAYLQNKSAASHTNRESSHRRSFHILSTATKLGMWPSRSMNTVPQ
ncbi:hypothetical protein E2C01_068890 [Portunus trituberculatus]|uniref:Uncharacterized protein n=1 Tax=Portunus trituberculatus TaxID=210409 RepID=A0A5B7HQ13_PORTR|nr:hypothetical protein [Portunus trituberculatus]